MTNEELKEAIRNAYLSDREKWDEFYEAIIRETRQSKQRPLQYCEDVVVKPIVPVIEELEAALINARIPSYGVHANCPKCGYEFVQENGEWLLWCGKFNHADAILRAARAYAELQLVIVSS